MTAPKILQSKEKAEQTGGNVETFIKNYVPLDDTTKYHMISIIGFTFSCFTIGTLGLALSSAFYSNNDYSFYNYGLLTLAASCAIQLQNGLTEQNHKKLFYWALLKAAEMFVLTGVLIYSFVCNYRNSNLGIPSFILLIATAGQLFYLWKHVYPTIKPVNNIPETVYDIPTSDHLNVNIVLDENKK